MKKYLSIVILIVLCCLLLCGCFCEPYAFEYNVRSYEKTVVFTNGAEQRILCGGSPNYRQPFAGEDNVSIRFFEDGTMQFQPCGDDLLSGTYTHYDDSKMKCTYCDVTLENGESFVVTIDAYYYNIEVSFLYRDHWYSFSREDEETEGMYDANLKRNVTDPLRLIEQEEQFREGYHGTVAKENGTFYLEMFTGIGREQVKDTLFLDENVAVYCARLDGENNLITMDSIAAGECLCFPTVEDEKITMVTIYYLEPLAENAE